MKKPFDDRNNKIHFLLQQSAIVFPSAARQYGQYDFVEFVKNPVCPSTDNTGRPAVFIYQNENLRFSNFPYKVTLQVLRTLQGVADT